MRSLVFEGKTWQAYEELRIKDRKLHRNLCKTLKEMLRGDPSIGLGKPEPLKHNLSGFWSRRLSQKDRLIYNRTYALTKRQKYGFRQYQYCPNYPKHIHESLL